MSALRTRAAGRRPPGLEALTPYVFVAPAFLLFLVFLAGPLLAAIGLSLVSWDLLTPPKFVGLDNYQRLLHDAPARHAIANTFVFSVASIVVHIIPGLGLALAVNRAIGPVLKYFLRTAFFFPLLVSWAAVALLWQYAMDPTFC